MQPLDDLEAEIKRILSPRGLAACQPALGDDPIVSETALTGPFDTASQR